ncbi:hypothetical protein [Streptomyces cinnamoneus]|uniref:hypothetical protein n=1 Tax=Streptomyces cinnamoneus TaxID=53446 RepID=UPI0037B8708A
MSRPGPTRRRPAGFALEARLHAAADALRERDAGRALDPSRFLPDRYRDVETEIARIRDTIAHPGPRPHREDAAGRPPRRVTAL